MLITLIISFILGSYKLRFLNDILSSISTEEQLAGDEPTAGEIRDLHEQQRVRGAEPVGAEANGELA